MNKRMREIRQEINNKRAEARNFASKGDKVKAKALIEEIRGLEDDYEIEAALHEDEKRGAKPTEGGEGEPKAKYNAEIFAKVVRGKKLTAEEQEIVNAVSSTDENGTSLLIPKDVETQIKELKREMKSARAIVGIYPTTTLEGSYPIESLETLTELTNFTDDSEDDIPESNAPKFTNVEYKIKDYGALLPLSNTVLKNETAGLVSYLARWFAKKAIRTENKKIFAKLKEGKEAKTINSLDDLRAVINKDVDAGLLPTSVIVTNQDGFDYMDSQKDETGRPLLQPHPTEPTKKVYKGLPIEVYSNAELPNNTSKFPIYVGDTTEGVDFVEREGLQFAMSSEAGFTKNKTYIRVIESFDVTQKDKGAYVYGEINPTQLPS